MLVRPVVLTGSLSNLPERCCKKSTLRSTFGSLPSTRAARYTSLDTVVCGSNAADGRASSDVVHNLVVRKEDTSSR